MIDIYSLMLRQGYHGGPGPTPVAWAVQLGC